MNKQYRPLEVGETIQEGDEVYISEEWKEAKRIDQPVYASHACKYRRPISLSTDTEALASKMAGLTDAVADAPSEWKDEDDLTWLAERVVEWPISEYSDIGEADYIKKLGKTFTYGFSREQLNCNEYTKDQWLQRRRELGLVPEQSKSTEPDHADLESWRQAHETWCEIFELLNELLPGWLDRGDTACDAALIAIRSLAEDEPQEQEWNGEGLPPVGYTHLQVEKPIGWLQNEFTVVAHVKGLIDEDGEKWEAAILCSERGIIKLFTDSELQPILSTAERKREKEIDAIEYVLVDSDRSAKVMGSRFLATAVYDAGYRKQDDE